MIDFVRTEAARLGRDPQAIEISNFAFVMMLAESPDASRQMREGMAVTEQFAREVIPALR